MDSVKNFARLAGDPAAWLLALVMGVIGGFAYIVLTNITF
jgi:hypothetical protein